MFVQPPVLFIRRCVLWRPTAGFTHCLHRSIYIKILTLVVCQSHGENVATVNVVVQGLLDEVLRLVPRQLGHPTIKKPPCNIIRQFYRPP